MNAIQIIEWMRREEKVTAKRGQKGSSWEMPRSKNNLSAIVKLHNSGNYCKIFICRSSVDGAEINLSKRRS